MAWHTAGYNASRNKSKHTGATQLQQGHKMTAGELVDVSTYCACNVQGSLEGKAGRMRPPCSSIVNVSERSTSLRKKTAVVMPSECNMAVGGWTSSTHAHSRTTHHSLRPALATGMRNTSLRSHQGLSTDPFQKSRTGSPGPGPEGWPAAWSAAGR